ncbi:MAG TPA: hypothetical protein VIY86_02745, partial [Pirellulaceae bacterium]
MFHGLILVAIGSGLGHGESIDSQASLRIDATDLPRRLLTATLRIPVDESLRRDGGTLTLWYPQWVQGSHAPGGPVQNIAGLEVKDHLGKALDWKRAPGEVHRFLVTVPRETTSVNVWLRYVCNQSTPNSHGLDSYGSEALGIISPNTVVLYPDGVRFPDWNVSCEITFPPEWKFATALTPDESASALAPGSIRFAPVSLDELIDSPIMLGRYVTTYDLVEPDVAAPPHRLHVFSEVESSTRIHDEVLARFRRLVTQATRLFGSHPFPSFDFLVATSNVLPRNGLEHHQSSLNVIPLACLDQPDHLKDWDRMLIPHEYVHAWCGKYRRPQGMITSNAHTPCDTELLWVYEGLTQYLGELLENRAGLATPEQYRWQLLQRLRWARLQQGRQWRPLSDTAAASHLLRAGSPAWGHLRRDQDYYFEGALFWLEVDTIIRRESKDERSLDDFCRTFFSAPAPTHQPVGYTRADIVDALQQLVPHGWEALISRRIEQSRERGPLSVANDLGYLVQFSNQSPVGPDNARLENLDARDSLGANFRADGTVESVILDSPADRARLGPEMRILGIGNFLWSRERLQEALEATPVKGKVRLLVVANDRVIRRTIS